MTATRNWKERSERMEMNRREVAARYKSSFEPAGPRVWPEFGLICDCTARRKCGELREECRRDSRGVKWLPCDRTLSAMRSREDFQAGLAPVYGVRRTYK